MSLLASARVVAGASGEESVDWEAALEAATLAVDRGSLDLDPGERAGYAADVSAARDRIRSVSGLAFDLPETIEIQHRHHWMAANVDTFREVMRPLADGDLRVTGAVRTLNTGTVATMLGFLGTHVLGQYDPLLLADAPPKLYFVRPNVRRVADDLAVPHDRFRRWIVFHEVTHAAEFDAAPWLADHLESVIESAVEDLARRDVDRSALAEINATMTAVEGYAEFLMDRAFDEPTEELRTKLDARRRGGGPLARLARRVFGLGMKRRQYERGARFFEQVADARGVEATGVVWESPETLPTADEFDHPAKWLRRVDA